ncbi:MAG: hypothetical protein V3V08_11630 [Nannocystaceae bacterium]
MSYRVYPKTTRLYLGATTEEQNSFLVSAQLDLQDGEIRLRVDYGEDNFVVDSDSRMELTVNTENSAHAAIRVRFEATERLAAQYSAEVQRVTETQDLYALPKTYDGAKMFWEAKPPLPTDPAGYRGYWYVASILQAYSETTSMPLAPQHLNFLIGVRTRPPYT